METFVKVLIYMNAITGIKFYILTYLLCKDHHLANI